MSNLHIVWAGEFAPHVPKEFYDPEFFSSIIWTTIEGGGHTVTTPLRPGRTYIFGPSAVLLVVSQPEIEGADQVSLDELKPLPPEDPTPPRKRFRPRA